MLSFATEFPINHARSATDFLSSIQSWILGSPHTQLTREDFAILFVSDESSVQKGDERIDALRLSSTEGDSAGIKYVKDENGLKWITTVVFSRTNSESWVGIRVFCESSRAAVCLPAAKKPVLIRTLFQELGGGLDGTLRVSDVPLRLANTDIDVAARLIKGATGCHLPIVYISAGFLGNYIVDCDRLAKDLGGMAHVVVEPNRPFSLRLKIEVDSENVYGGTVGVYLPAGGGRRSFFIGRELDSPEKVAHALFGEIRTALTNRRAFDRCTWAFVQEAVSRQAIRALQASGSQEVEKYVEEFDKELAAKKQRLEDAEKEIRHLRSELKIYEARFATGTTSFLRTGREQDLYPNEILSIVRDAIKDASTRVAHDSRRQHVLAAILQATPVDEDAPALMRTRLRVYP